MSIKSNITVESMDPWDSYAKGAADAAFARMYAQVEAHSKIARGWYWKSIKTKKAASFLVRAVSFILLVCGALLPLVAALFVTDTLRLACTQVAVAALALAGLCQAADRVFGWSSGWLRYITTVTAMESATRQFGIDWASYIVAKGTALDDGDRRPLFEIAKKFDSEISKLQADETQTWVTEFNSSMAALSDLIKAQRDSAEKAMDAARQTLQAQRAADLARGQDQRPGSIELTLTHQGNPIPVSILLDDELQERFLGTVWSRVRVSPGQHTLTVVSGDNDSPRVQIIADVPPGGICKASVGVI